MGSGGARNRSGPPVDPNSARSDARGYKLNALPSEGYQFGAPAFPLPDATARELDIWAELWATPQACAWSMQSWRWFSLANLARNQERFEQPDSPIGLVTAIRQGSDDNGLTTAGLRANGWSIAVDEVGEKRDERADREADEGEDDAPRRLTSVPRAQ